MLVIRPTCTHAQFTLQQHRHTYVFSYIYTILALHIFYLCCARRLFKRPQMQRTKYVDSFVGSSAVIQLHVAGTPEEGKKGARVS